MKNFEELEQFINQHENDWQYCLLHKPFNLKAVKQCNYNKNWYCLMYNLFDSIFDNSFEGKVVKECRGTIVEKIPGQPCKIIAAPYTKFFNYGEDNAATIDWKSAVIREKIDGWLIKCVIYTNEFGKKSSLWFSNGSFLDLVEPGEVDSTINVMGFQFSTINEVLNCALTLAGGFDKKSHSYMFNDHIEYYQSWMKNIPNGTTFMFELTSAWTKICTTYNSIPQLWLHGCRLADGQEITPEQAKEQWDMPFEVPQQFSFNNIEEIQNYISNWKGSEHEGVVVCDKDFNRVKIKCEDYLKIKYTTDYADMMDRPKNVWKCYLEGEYDDILAVAPYLKDKIEEMHDEIENLKFLYLKQARKSQEIYKDCGSVRKDFASKVLSLNLDSVLKSLYFNHFMNESEDKDIETFNKYMQSLSRRKDGYKIYERLKEVCNS